MIPPFERRYGSTAGRGTAISSISAPVIPCASVMDHPPEANPDQPLPASGCCARPIADQAGECPAGRGAGGKILGFLRVDDLPAGTESAALGLVRSAASRGWRAPGGYRAWVSRRDRG